MKKKRRERERDMYLNKLEIKTHGVWRRLTLEIDFMYETELREFIRIAFGEKEQCPQQKVEESASKGS